MAFVTVPGLKGKVFVPEQKEKAPKKHPCEDCYACQMCSNDRCEVCLGQKGCRCEALSMKDS
jgi:hypothetical protein